MSRSFRRFGSATTSSSITFPVIAPEREQWQWPLPPFNWRHEPSGNNVEQPCRIETTRGSTVEGQLVDVDPGAGCLTFRGDAGQAIATVPFHDVRRLILTTPLLPAARTAGAPTERVPAAAQEREYRLHMSENGEVMSGRTVGYIETEMALYLFPQLDEERALQRVLVPRSAYTKCEFGRSAEEVAAERWIATPERLVSALDRQARMPVLRMGEALLNLGLITPRQLTRALESLRADVPLGEMLVASGVISRTDLHTALAHKMGYPLVDLARFPIAESAVRLLPPRLAVESFALPLMVHAERLIVAVDRPSRTTRLHNLRALAGLKLVPVLAPKSQIMLALGELAQRDIWKHNIFAQLVFPSTTT